MQNEVNRHYRHFKAEGIEVNVRMTVPPPARDPARLFASSVDDMFEYSLRDIDPGDMVGISVHNEDNQQFMTIRLRYRRKNQISGDVLWSVFQKVTQSKANYQATDTISSLGQDVRWTSKRKRRC